MRLIDADEVVKFYKNMGEEFMELTVIMEESRGKAWFTVESEWGKENG